MDARRTAALRDQADAADSHDVGTHFLGLRRGDGEEPGEDKGDASRPGKLDDDLDIVTLDQSPIAARTLLWETDSNGGAHGQVNMKLWLGNIAPGTSDDEIRQFVGKYAPDLECVSVQRVDGDGSRPAAMLEFAATPHGSVETIAMRLHGMYWKGRGLYVQTLSR